MLRALMLFLYGMTEEQAQWIASDEFLKSYEWRKCRYKALDANDGRCECCGRNKHQLPEGEYLNVDHIHPRKVKPWLALDHNYLQILCVQCNHGKGNTTRDWRE